jgi:anti-anti-sigma factor
VTPITITTELEGDSAARVQLTGRLDGEAAADLADTLERMLRDGRRSVVLDLGGVTYLSSPGTLALQHAHQEWSSLRGDLRVAALSPAAHDALAAADLLPRLSPEAPADGRAAAALSLDHTRDNWQIPANLDARGSYEVASREPGAELSCRLYGRPESALRGWIQPGDYHPIDVPENAFGLGIGALGTSRPEAGARLGELVAAAGAVAHLPTLGSQVPDFDVGLGGRPPHALLVSGFLCGGAFSVLTRFSSATEADAVPMSELARVCLEAVGSTTAGFVMVAEATGLIGAWLRRSPGVEMPSMHLHLQGLRDWLGTTPTPIHPGTTVIVAGVVSRRPEPSLAGHLRPIGAGGLLGHLHAVVFTYRPVPQRTIALRALVTRLFGQQRVRGLLHLIADDRGAAGVGESRFRRGLCWAGPITRVVGG